MKVYRGNLENFNSNEYFPYSCVDDIYYAISGVRSILQPHKGTIVHTSSSFVAIGTGANQIAPSKYYRCDGMRTGSTLVKWTEITTETAESNAVISVFDIMEATYSGKDMGERKIVATIKWGTPIDFQIGDYVEIPLQTLRRGGDGQNGIVDYERFYIYTEPQCKKTARPMMAGDAFETNVTFYPRQYELGCVQMRDFIQQNANESQIIYTGFDNVTFVGGAHELLERCMACLAQQYKDNDGLPLWQYDLANTLNEVQNNSLERYAFSFKNNSVMDALMKLNATDYINTTFFINDRTVYVGYRRPYLCKVNSLGVIDKIPLNLAYGKTSHQAIDIDHGGLFTITKAVGNEIPVTQLFAYGAARNLNRYYCSDRIKSGRYVNKLMLPSFSEDGETDWIVSEDGIKRYGVRQGSKDFEEIYPSLRYMTYADIRCIKYCIKVHGSGLDEDWNNVAPIEGVDGKKSVEKYLKHVNSGYQYGIARIQCYRVDPCTGDDKGHNKLTMCAPPDDLAVFVHAQGKTVKCVLYAAKDGKTAIQRQIEHDGTWSNGNGRIPAHTLHGDDYYPGACYCVHDDGFDGVAPEESERDSWFTTDSDSELHRIEYVDTFWLTDLYVFESYNQRVFQRDGYSAWAWPRLNNDSGQSDSLFVNEIVATEPVVIVDTSDNEHTRQKTWDIYLRDIGFGLDEQNDFGEMVFVFDTVKVSMLDGVLAGREFTVDGGQLTDFQDRCVCLIKNDGTINQQFYEASGYTDRQIPINAAARGAIWRLRLNRLNVDELAALGIIVPSKDFYASEGDHCVLLDIYMPDIYIRAAEARLQKEAQKYLERNDNGNISYAVEFDKVRINQVQGYALQMREGVNVRMIDDDLNIMSDNHIRQIVNHSPGFSTLVSLSTEVTNVTTEIVVTQIDDHLMYEFKNRRVQTYDSSSEMLTIKMPRTSNSQFDKIALHYGNGKYYVPTIVSATPTDNNGSWLIMLKCDYILYKDLTSEDAAVFTDVYEEVTTAQTYKYSNAGDIINAICNEIVEFRAGKSYEVVVDVDANFLREEGEDSEGNLVRRQFMLSNTKAVINSVFIPEYVCEQISDSQATGLSAGMSRLKYSFYLDDSFNDAMGYYPVLQYVADGETENSTVVLVSVTECDIDSAEQVVPYADFVVESVTVKINDNTRDTAVRIGDNRPEPIRTITASLKEKTQATTWNNVMNRLEDVAIETESNKALYEEIANQARLNYRALLGLRNSIFDPDSDTNNKCDYNFLHVMMLQVGADSMNYQMEKTFTTPTGVPSNFTVGKNIGDTYQHFRVAAEDTLHHFVFAEGAQGGNWKIPGLYDKELAPITTTNEQNEQETTWPTYYICMRCKKDTDNVSTESAWICSTHQYAVNQATDPENNDSETFPNGERVDSYWFFNWGILNADSNGNYTLVETRGNAYMYGDNIICGVIKTLAGNSYFDLTHGNFVLSKLGPVNGQYTEGMTYINGKLTIYGVNDNSVDSILSRLGLTEAVANGAATLAASAQATANEAQTKVNNVIDDGIISGGTEKITLIKEFQEIAGDNMFCNENGSLKKAIDLAKDYGLEQPDWSGLTYAYSLLELVMMEIIGYDYDDDVWTEDNIDKDTYVGADYEDPETHETDARYDISIIISGTRRNVDRELFNYLWRQYYDAEIALLNKVSQVIDTREVGGENYIGEANPFVIEAADASTDGDGANYHYCILIGETDGGNVAVNSKPLEPSTKYVFSCNNSIAENTLGGTVPTIYRIAFLDFDNGTTVCKDPDGNDMLYDLKFGEPVTKTFVTPTSGNPRLVIYAGMPGSTSGIKATFYDLMVQRGDKPSSYNAYYQHLVDALHGQTDIAGGLLLTNLIMLRDEKKRVVSGISGMSDSGRKRRVVNGHTRYVQSEGVGFWANGSYQQALDQAMGLINELPVLLTKTGIRSRLGCFEVVSSRSVAVYDENRQHRVLITSGSDMSLRMQYLSSGVWEDQLIISNDDIDITYETYTLVKGINYPTIKEAGSGLNQYLIKFTDETSQSGYTDRITLPALGQGETYKCDISADDKLELIVSTGRSSWYLDKVYIYGTLSLVMIANNAYFTIAETPLVGWKNESEREGDVLWKLGMPTVSGDIASGGDYGLLLYIEKFVRVNKAGVSYESTVNDSSFWKDATFGAQTTADIHFSKAINDNRAIMKIGRNGMVVQCNASLFFMAKTEENNGYVDIRIGGLPTLSADATTNGLYKGANGQLFIK